jgi:hypothetical protein
VLVSSAMTPGVREEHENGLEWSRRQRDEIVEIWYAKALTVSSDRYLGLDVYKSTLQEMEEVRS